MNVLMVGVGGDTNGQKVRFVRAAERWGDDPDVLKALWAGRDDMAGVAGRFAAASKEGPLRIRSAHKAQYAYFQFPIDVDWNRHNEWEVKALADEADVLHLTNDVKAYFRLRAGRSRKPAVLHHHGTLFRSQHRRLLADAHRLHMVQAVSTVDLMRYAPDRLRWVPTAYNLDELARIREEHRRPDDGMVRIAHAPTNREIKSTAALEAAVATLKAEGLPVELLLIEGKTWAETLRLKATADIYFDQVGLGYGCNAVEAWGMGIPVIAGADDWTLDRMRSMWGHLPFMVASEGTIGDAIRMAVKNKSLRKRYADIGHAFAQQYHAEKPALQRLAEVYHEAIELRRAAPDDVVEEHRRGAGVFRTDGKPDLRLRLASRYVWFKDGQAEVTDPELAQRLRRMATNGNAYGIVEVGA